MHATTSKRRRFEEAGPKMRSAGALFVAVVLTLSETDWAAALDDPRVVVPAVEAVLSGLRAQAAALYAGRCSKLASDGCLCSHAAWGSSPATLSTSCSYSGQVENAGLCGSCLAGVRRTANVSYVTRSPHLAPAAEPGAEGEGQTPATSRQRSSEDMCWTSRLDPALMTAYEDPGVSRFLYHVGIATHGGVERRFPGQPSVDDGGIPEKVWETRDSNWYAASTGPKDVVVLLDVSHSMLYNKAWEGAKRLTEEVLSLLTPADWVSVVAVNDRTREEELQGHEEGTLRPATAENTWAYRRELCRMKTGSGTLLAQGLRKAFQILTSSQNRSQSSLCDAYVIVVTDGDFRERHQYLLDKITEYTASFEQRTQRRAHLVVYALSRFLRRDTLKAAACRTHGMLVSVPLDTKEEISDDRLALLVRVKARLWLEYASLLRAAAVSASAGFSCIRDFMWSDESNLFSYNRSGAVVSLPVYDSRYNASSYPTVPALVGVVSASVFFDQLDGNFTTSSSSSSGNFSILSPMYRLLHYGGLSADCLCRRHKVSLELEQLIRARLLGSTEVCTAVDLGEQHNASSPEVDPSSIGPWLHNDSDLCTAAIHPLSLWCDTSISSDRTLSDLQTLYCCPDLSCALPPDPRISPRPPSTPWEVDFLAVCWSPRSSPLSLIPLLLSVLLVLS